MGICQRWAAPADIEELPVIIDPCGCATLKSSGGKFSSGPNADTLPHRGGRRRRPGRVRGADRRLVPAQPGHGIPGDGVVAQASGKGVGAALLTRARDWAAGHGLHRLELTVMAHNHQVADLYRRMGFSIEGRRSQCLFVDGRFIDELYMAALLPGQNPADPPAGTPGQRTA
jgi:Acetyltransferase (GNAT) family